MSFFYRLFWLTLILKLVIGYFLPLLPDEAYYWVWSHNLQLSYYDHPPMIAWLFRVGHFLEPFGNSIRFPSIILLHLSLFIWREIFSTLKLKEESFHRFLIYLMLVPYLGVGSIILTPDLPLMFFWPLSFYFFLKVLENNDRWTNYSWLGASLGLGFLSKYHIVLFLVAAISYLFIEKKWSKIRWQFVPFTLVLGLLFCAPVIVWNAKNGFQSFTFQLQHGLQAKQWKWIWPVEYVVGQFFMLIPPLTFYFFKGRSVVNLKPFFYFTSAILVFFLLTSFKSSVEMNWTLMAFPMFFALVSCLDVPKKIVSGIFIFLALFNVGLIASMFTGYYPHGKIFEPFFFESQKNMVTKHRPLYGINYQISSSLWYFSKTPVLKIEGASRFDFFDTLHTLPMQKLSQKTIYVFKELRNEYPDWINDLKPKAEIVETMERGYVVEKLEFE